MHTVSHILWQQLENQPDFEKFSIIYKNYIINFKTFMYLYYNFIIY